MALRRHVTDVVEPQLIMKLCYITPQQLSDSWDMWGDSARDWRGMRVVSEVGGAWQCHRC